MKSLLTLGVTAMLIGAAPAWAGPGHGYGHDKHWAKHAEKQWKKEHKYWAKEQKHWARHHAYYGPVYESHVVYAPPAVVERRVVHRVVEHHHVVPVAPAPAPGVHVVMPNIYVPF